MNKQAIISENAPAAIGPYSHANIIGNLVFVSGQLPIKDEKIVEDIPEATRACLTNLKNVLETAGSSIEQCVKVVVYLRDMKDFAQMNAVYAEFFTHDEPARSCFAVAGLPKDAKVEIEAIAYL